MEIQQLNDYKGDVFSPFINCDTPSTIHFGEEYITDILSTSRNYIVRENVVGNIDYLYFSNDSGRTWKQTQNTLGVITFIHFFSNGDVLICTGSKCYYTNDFVTFNETKVYDYDGTLFTAPEDTYSFFRLGCYNSEYHEINGVESLAWNDYNYNRPQYVSRVWLTNDYGRTLKCILKSGVKDKDGNTITVRHFHRTTIEDKNNVIWVTSGDEGSECRLSKGLYNSTKNEWEWETIGTPGALYKLSQFDIIPPYARFVTDYTGGTNETGLVICPLNKLDDTSAFRYLYKTEFNEAMSKIYEDGVGNKVITGDGAQKNVLWIARGNYDFKKVNIQADFAPYLGAGNIIGANYLGQVVMYYTNRESGWGNGNGSLSNGNRMLLSSALRDAGIFNFGNCM